MSTETNENYIDTWERGTKQNTPLFIGKSGVGRKIYVKEDINAINAERVAAGEPPMQVVMIDPEKEYQFIIASIKDAGKYIDVR